MTITKTKPDAIVSYLPDLGVYVECLATRNNLEMHGSWIDLTLVSEEQDYQDAIDYILKTSPTPGAEEYEITDNTCPTFLAELPIKDQIEWIDIRENQCCGEAEQEAYEIYTNDINRVCDYDVFQSAFMGVYASETDFCMSREEDSGNDLGNLSNYIDWDRVWDGEYECAGYRAFSISLGRIDAFGGRAVDVAIFAPV